MIRAILDGANQIAVPAFVSTLSICIVFVPIFFLSGTAKYLFQPLAMAVISAMLASYLLSPTVVPTMVKFLLRGHMKEIDTSLGRTLNDGSGSAGGPRAESGGLPDSSSSGGKEDFAPGGRKGHASRVRPTTGIFGAISGFFFAIHEHFNRGFEKIRDCYVAALRWCLSHRGLVFAAMGGVVLISPCLVPFLGRDFFPAVVQEQRLVVP